LSQNFRTQIEVRCSKMKDEKYYRKIHFIFLHLNPNYRKNIYIRCTPNNMSSTPENIHPSFIETASKDSQPTPAKLIATAIHIPNQNKLESV
jgi:hypothetical protein